jgi:beta-glucosidase-like glycosyl hydrolase/CubicO group peptidase (beta-lactamase class C family)
MKKLILSALCFIEVFGFPSFSNSLYQGDFPFNQLHTPWVDSVFNSLTPDQRIGQLFFMAAYSNKNQKHVDLVAEYVAKHHVGGLLFFQGGPGRQATLTNYYQRLSQTPLLIAIDAEWGLGMRLDSCIAFPRQMPLGAVQETDLIYRMGLEIGRQCRRMGIHLNFAPVVDINNHPDNPVIGIRSFGENSGDVTRRSLLYMTALQEQHILTAAKHFPGHGNTTTDSHHALPVVNESYQALDSLEWRPYKELIRHQLTGVLAAHLHVPALDTTVNLATSLSRKVLTDILRDSLGFRGLVYTDALNMKGVAQFFSPGELEIKALEAGADVLLMPNDLPLAIAAIKAAVKSGRISMEQIDRSCRKILAAKQWAGLNQYHPIETGGLTAYLNRAEANLLYRQLVASSLTVLRNHNDILPLKNLAQEKTAILITGASLPNHFLQTLRLYEENDYFFLNENTTATQEKELAETLKAYTRVIVGIHNTRYHAEEYYGIKPAVFSFVDRLAENTRAILCVFAPPYALSYFKNKDKLQGIVVAYQDAPLFQDYAAQLLYGALAAKSRLPVSVDSAYPYRSGMQTAGDLRLKYVIPEEAGIAPAKLLPIDTMIQTAIKQGVIPGCQILAARNGMVFFKKEYGQTRYDDQAEPVHPGHIYDLASITKISAALPAIMRLYDRNEVKLHDRLDEYLPFVKGGDQAAITLLDLLTHQARLSPFIPFHLKVMQATDTTSSKDALHQRQVAQNLFVLNTFRDTIFDRIKQARLLPKKQYLYSDLGFILLTALIEQQAELPLDEYVSLNFYSRLGASTMGYHPLERFPQGRIVPTANDTMFRKQWLQGYVHDENAALMGGVSGHAGLFANANDLAKLMQLYLNKGVYGGERYFEANTIEYFTSAPFGKQGNRRGIGFDKPEPDPKKLSPACACASPKSYGHSGFTGTYVWMDPETGLLFIFLSNRICPDTANNKLTTSNLRTRIYRVFAESIL